MPNLKLWDWAKGMISKIFTCKRCGFCCHGETTVSLDQNDVERMAKALQLGEDQLKEKYLRITGDVVQMKIIDGHCIFYDEGCSVHEGRPWRCRQWPLHPAILKDENNLRTIQESCPGINPHVEYEEFCTIMKALEEKAA